MVYSRRVFLFIILTVLSLSCFGQNRNEILLADSFYEDGEYTKAQKLYENILKSNLRNSQVYLKLLSTYSKTNNPLKQDSLVNFFIGQFPNSPDYHIDAAQLSKRKKDKGSEEKHLTESFKLLDANPSYAFSMANRFTYYQDPRNALRCYQFVEKNYPKYDYSLQKAQLYGELGIVDSMLYNYFALIDKNPARKSNVKRYIENFLRQNKDEEHTEEVKNVLLIKIQETNNPIYSELLVWYFINKSQYTPAFIQAKSLYLRSYYDLGSLMLIADEANQGKDYRSAQKIYKYILEENTNDGFYFEATRKYLELQKYLLKDKLSEKQILKKYEEAIQLDAFNEQHFILIISYCRYLAKENPDEALESLNKYSSRYKNYDDIMAMKYLLEGDIYLKLQKFSEAFIAYQKAETFTSNQNIEDEAKFKSVKIAFYKEDYKWALQQAKVLKKSHTKYYANDSAELMILLQNSYQSDSSEVALKLYSRAELFKMQNELDSAYTYYSKISSDLPYHYLKANAMYAIAEIYEEKGDFDLCVYTLEELYKEFPINSIAPLALFKLSEVYLHRLNNKDKSKKWVEELASKFPNSKYSSLAREMFLGQ